MKDSDTPRVGAKGVDGVYVLRDGGGRHVDEIRQQALLGIEGDAFSAELLRLYSSRFRAAGTHQIDIRSSCFDGLEHCFADLDAAE